MKRFDIYLIQLDPAIGSEINKTRPGVIISPDELFKLKTVIIAPMTSKGFSFQTRIECNFQNKKGYIVLDQLRSIDKKRLIKKIGSISKNTQIKIAENLQKLFAL